MPISGQITTRSPKADPLEEAIRAFKAGSASVENVAAAFYASPRVKRLVAHACFGARVSPDFSDEVIQQLALLLVQKFVFSVKDPDKIYNVLHLSACHIARRKSEKSGEDSLEAVLERTGEIDPSAAAILADDRQEANEIVERLDQENAAREFNRRFRQRKEDPSMQPLSTSIRMSVIDPALQVIPRMERVRPPKPVHQEGPSKEAIELNDIRRDLGYTVPEFAERLNITKGTLSSYLYGIVKNVPPAVMEEARNLNRNSGTDFKQRAKIFASLSMDEIVARWLKALHIDPEDNARDTLLAKVLRVDRVTVWRWHARNMRPEPRKLNEYELLVQAASKRRRRAAIAA